MVKVERHCTVGTLSNEQGGQRTSVISLSKKFCKTALDLLTSKKLYTKGIVQKRIHILLLLEVSTELTCFISCKSGKTYLLVSKELEAVNLGSACRIHGSPAATVAPPPQLPTEESVDALCNTLHHWHHCPELYKAIEGIRFIAEHTKREEDSTRVKEDWKYVAMVLDRLFLWIFTLAVVVGTAGIILQAPTLYDDRIPIDVRLSEIASTTAKPHIVPSL
ncbi:hypothetical protein M0802_006253 [Mischocyttarus mexicanus]|nr:hypothetical protein M0802_006253 [Mischocyttarus mexicanus]